jgi:molecular chaperone DnaK
METSLDQVGNDNIQVGNIDSGVTVISTDSDPVINITSVTGNFTFDSIDVKKDGSLIIGEAYGIDLGTTNSCISLMINNIPVVIPNCDGDKTTPSVVAYPKGNKLCVGKTALEQQFEKVAISSVKRHMGEVPPEAYFSINDNKLLPEDISSEILKKIVNDANLNTGKRIYNVVITVPAYFGHKERAATVKAAKKIFLNVLRVVNEPTAAAVAYADYLYRENEYVKSNLRKKILVYDLGGGTFDVSIVEYNGEKVEVLATAGDKNLGGVDWNNALKNTL